MTRTTIEVMAALCAVTQSLPMGTNLALSQLLWMLLSGQLLPSRGALFPGLKAIGLSTAAIRRAWAAFRYGAWHMATLLTLWQQYVTEQPHWQALQYEGYVPIAVDITPYWRPALEGCASKHYHPQAGKALQPVEFGLIGCVGHVNGQRVTLLTDVLRGDLTDASSASLASRLLKRVAATLTADEVAVLDAGFKVKAVQAAGISRFVVRGAKNFAARRNTLPPYTGRGRKPEYGVLVRPVARKRKGRTIAATPPDRAETWQADGLALRAQHWYDLVTTDTKVNPHNVVSHVVTIYDPRFKEPWVLVTSLKLSGHTLWRLYQARWPIEQVPLVAKQTLGGARQFVHAPESCRRLPELTLLASTMLTRSAWRRPCQPRRPASGTASPSRRLGGSVVC